MNNYDKLYIAMAYTLWQEHERERAGMLLKSTSTQLSYSYSYTHQIDLGQGRTRFIHLGFSLNPEINQLNLVSESISDA